MSSAPAGALGPCLEPPAGSHGQPSLGNLKERLPHRPSMVQALPRAACPHSRHPVPVTFAICGMLGSLLNPARGILSCNVFTLDLAKKKK